MSKKSKNPKKGICIYCGLERTLTDDHIPPKSIFPRPRATNLITVPCCSDCNHDAHLDDMYFKDVLVSMYDVKDHPAIPKLHSATRLRVNSVRNTFYRQMLFGRTKKVHAMTASGVYLGEKTGFHVDTLRIKRVLERIARGLYFNDFGQPLSKDYTFVTLYPDEFDLIRVPIMPRLRKVFLQVAFDAPHKVIVKDVFEYQCQEVQPKVPGDSTSMIAWVFHFFVQVIWFTIAIKDGSLPSTNLESIPKA